jgi:hypothetical protein
VGLHRRLRVVRRLALGRVRLAVLRWWGLHSDVGRAVRAAHLLAVVDLAQLLANGTGMAEAMRRTVCTAD